MNLYHYTDAQAVQSILVNRKLWLTDLRFMNDSTELSHGVEILKKAMEHQPHGLFYDWDYAEKAMSYLSNSLDEYEDASWTEDPVFAMSFSRKDDLLSQWRGYGNYAVAFDSERLKEFGLKLRDCIYDSKSKADQASQQLTNAGTSISRSMAEINGCISVDSIDKQIELIELAATFKDAGFEEESEVRMIARPDQHDIKYRPRNGMLIPYVEIEIPAEAIVSVRVGPIRDQHLASLSMKMFLGSVESAYRSDGGDVEWSVPVDTSKTPYRQ
ncbi:hypothetical protein TB9_20130 [Xanthomonas perforans]|uniref:DUF2971 domain-containing protein n=3 Tax=Xanthomonas TaxID=338 RepID=A0ABR5EM40_XANPE|nr:MULTISPECIES: DUF2971 domain-containing protein [Xanthomonas]KLC02013.1 hypothetical protein XP315_20875 [Xanthomonas perforans]KLC12624.1 hypothetical protein XP4B_06785 [Xanthomonas perforans]KLC22695.1 hypothetical protein XP816_16260 [Xanthomonas perforans]KLC24425.1 hypothetical protein XP56_00005 [Xanthomonas perforans]KLC29257.1 hypothetical protein XP112_22785 [Xanthomonas perforans]